MARFQYSIATGSSVALASLQNIEDYFAPYIQPKPLGIASSPVNRFPIRELTASGVEVGYGSISHSWRVSLLPDEAFTQFITDFCNTDGSGNAVTIYTRRHDLGSYGRYNANLAYPAVNEDYIYRSGYMVEITIRFTNLVAL